MQATSQLRIADANRAPAAFTVNEFCEAHRISRALFYILLRDGRGPRIIKAGSRTLVSAEAAETWRRAMESQQQVAAA